METRERTVSDNFILPKKMVPLPLVTDTSLPYCSPHPLFHEEINIEFSVEQLSLKKQTSKIILVPLRTTLTLHVFLLTYDRVKSLDKGHRVTSKKVHYTLKELTESSNSLKHIRMSVRCQVCGTVSNLCYRNEYILKRPLWSSLQLSEY